jgi:tRNA dimethylallyltransferase
LDQSKKVIIVCGPTAVGKTAYAIELAKTKNTEIISADSRQCYHELGIAVAKPSLAELQTIPHYFVNSHSIQEEVNAGVFETFALEKTMELFKDHEEIVMVGGTGLYIKAFCEGMDDMPAIDLVMRQKIIQNYEAQGLLWLQKQVAEKDPAFWAIAEQKNPQRLMRGLEVVEATGISITAFRKMAKKERPFEIIKIGLELPREQLNERINQRVDNMVAEGLVEEARQLFPYRNNNALQTVGYQELFESFEGKISEIQAIEQIKQHSRQYAKRQMTWFKKDPTINWINI